jgi:uncharacterized membrane protein YphA (DoxX/SURF4 family)
MGPSVSTKASAVTGPTPGCCINRPTSGRRAASSHSEFIAFLVAYGEFAIGLGLVLGVLVRTASLFGLVFMLVLLFSSGYPGPQAAFWQYFGASLDQSVFALCFAAFALGDADRAFSLRAYIRKRH